MLTEQPLLITSITAQADLNKYDLINYGGYPTQAGDTVFGVCNADTASGEECPVMIQGIALVKSGGYFNSGSFLVSDDNGRAVISGDTSHSLEVFAVAIDSSPSAGSLVRVKLL